MRFRLLRAGTYRFCSLFQAPSAHSHFVLTTTSTAPIPLPLVSFPSPFFVSHTITLTPSSHDLPQFHHKHTLSLTHIQWATFQRKRRGHLKRDSEQGQIDRSILAPLLHALSPHTHIHYFDLSFYHSLFHSFLSLILFSSSS